MLFVSGVMKPQVNRFGVSLRTKEKKLKAKRIVLIVAAVLLITVVPGWAAHTNSVTWTPTQSTKIGGTELQPGDYVIRAGDGATKVQVLSHGKMVAEVPCQWTNLSEKAQASEVDVDNGQVMQVKFAGKTSALSFQ